MTTERAPVTRAGRHRRDDLPPEGILAEAMRAWRSRRGGRRQPMVTTVPASAPAPSPVAGGPARD